MHVPLLPFFLRYIGTLVVALSFLFINAIFPTNGATDMIANDDVTSFAGKFIDTSLDYLPKRTVAIVYDPSSIKKEQLMALGDWFEGDDRRTHGELCLGRSQSLVFTTTSLSVETEDGLRENEEQAIVGSNSDKPVGLSNDNKGVFTLEEFKTELVLIDPLGDGIIHDNLLLISGKLPNSLTVTAFSEYVKRGGNVLWILTTELDEGMEEIDEDTRMAVLEFGRIIDPFPASIKDPLNNVVSGDDNSGISLKIPSTYGDRIFAGRETFLNGVNAGTRGVNSIDEQKVTCRGCKAHRLDPSNPLVFPLITAKETAYGKCILGKKTPIECKPAYGDELIIASALQTRVNSRVVLVTIKGIAEWGDKPTIDLFNFIDSPASVNDDGNYNKQQLNFIGRDLLSWTFQETGLIGIKIFEHNLVLPNEMKDEEGKEYGRYHTLPRTNSHIRTVNDPKFQSSSTAPSNLGGISQQTNWYRIGDYMTIRLCLLQKNQPGHPWTAIQPSDLQAEISMLTPWIKADFYPTTDGCLSTTPSTDGRPLLNRIDVYPPIMTTPGGPTIYSTNSTRGLIKLPTRYGLYTLRLKYQRRGWPHVQWEERMVVRPLNHDEVIRFVPEAIPYYVVWVSMMLGALLMVFPLIYGSIATNKNDDIRKKDD